MLAWIFRHRTRLQVVYGRVTPPPLAGTRFAQPAPPCLEQLVEGGDGPLEPGRLRLRARGQVEIRPMPRRVA
jgi:hypothetical protein